MSWESLTSESGIRMSFFFGILLVMSCWELLAPRKKLTANKPLRWASNLGLTFLNSIVLRILIPLGAVSVAEVVEIYGWGLFHQLGIPVWLKILVAVVLLDCAIYWQHVVSHKIPMFWQFHKVHHVDLNIDVTTGSRFHTVEILLSFAFKLVLILIFGIAPDAVLIFEIMLNGTAMFNHSNVFLPLWIDKVLRLFLVTPDMHRVHHSVLQNETDSNYGFNLPWWDYLFHTYIPQPKEGHDGMTIGLKNYQTKKAEQLPWMLLFPFQAKKEEENSSHKNE
ncbi:Fatty acid hydroxylase family (carotene hydroxylase/sterol desaturase) [hydrothermal vent metagenome]|uniref:Fatty acid hydroxylase family (Carotene hydroxylase/sterol desaturase) n=1 Tax=hydrothermal vent metagenome TaxID=652676 RepID=A0A3B1DXL0_9ZZZZ